MVRKRLGYKGKLLVLDPTQKSDIAKNWEVFARQRIVGQPRLVKSVSSALEKAHAGLSDKTKPLISLLALGPSGVGKTLLAKVLAEFLFDDSEGLIRINGQEFSESHAVSRLTGAPPGYKGYGDEPLITQIKLDSPAFLVKIKDFFENLSAEKRREFEELKDRMEDLQRVTSFGSQQVGYNPLVESTAILEEMKRMGHPEYNPRKETYPSILLVDEIGRAHRSLQNILYTILDEAKFASEEGELVRFHNTFIFITDNVGSEKIADLLRRRSGESVRVGFGVQSEVNKDANDKEIYDLALRAAKKFFETPFLNRVDKIEVARPLSKRSLLRILRIEIKKLHDRFNREGLPLCIDVSDGVKNFIVNEALDKPEENARLLARKLNKHIAEKLTTFVVTNQIAAGDYVKITRKRSSKELLFQKVPLGNGKKVKLIIPPE